MAENLPSVPIPNKVQRFIRQPAKALIWLFGCTGGLVSGSLHRLGLIGYLVSVVKSHEYTTKSL